MATRAQRKRNAKKHFVATLGIGASLLAFNIIKGFYRLPGQMEYVIALPAYEFAAWICVIAAINGLLKYFTDFQLLNWMFGSHKEYREVFFNSFLAGFAAFDVLLAGMTGSVPLP